jgi:hypothetical protein
MNPHTHKSGVIFLLYQNIILSDAFNVRFSFTVAADSSRSPRLADVLAFRLNLCPISGRENCECTAVNHAWPESRSE